MMRKPINERIAHSVSDWLRVEFEGSLWTVIPSAIVFGLKPSFVTDVGEDQTRITNTNFTLVPSTFVSLKYNSCEKIAKRLSDFPQPSTSPFKWTHKKYCTITADEVKNLIMESLKNKQYLAVGKNIIQLYFVIDTFLKRLPINEGSKWILIVGSDRKDWFKDFMEISADKLMVQHINVIPSVGMAKEQKKEDLEEKLYEKLKKRLRGEKDE